MNGSVDSVDQFSMICYCFAWSRVFSALFVVDKWHSWHSVTRGGGSEGRQDRRLVCANMTIFCYCQLGLSKVCRTVLLTLDPRPCFGDIQHNNRVVLQCVAISFHAVWAIFALSLHVTSSWINSVHYSCIKFYFKYLLIYCKILSFWPDYLSFSFRIDNFHCICSAVSTGNLISIRRAEIQKYFEGYVLFFRARVFSVSQWAASGLLWPEWMRTWFVFLETPVLNRLVPDKMAALKRSVFTWV